MNLERRTGQDRRVAERRQASAKDEVKATSPFLIPPLEANKFFAKEFPLLKVPEEVYKTEERLREIGFTRAEQLILPQYTLSENDQLWEGRVKPGPFFWTAQRNGQLKPESPILEQGIYLIDGRKKPDYQSAEQRYEDDEFMEDLIKGLRKKGAVQRYKFVPNNSRFGATAEDIEQVILPEFARAIGKDALGSEGKVINTSYKIFNIAGNMRHRKWGSTSTYELFSDECFVPETRSNYRLRGGNSDYGGLASVGNWPSDARNGFVGFRPLIVFNART